MTTTESSGSHAVDGDGDVSMVDNYQTQMPEAEVSAKNIDVLIWIPTYGDSEHIVSQKLGMIRVRVPWTRMAMKMNSTPTSSLNACLPISMPSPRAGLLARRPSLPLTMQPYHLPLQSALSWILTKLSYIALSNL